MRGGRPRVPPRPGALQRRSSQARRGRAPSATLKELWIGQATEVLVQHIGCVWRSAFGRLTEVRGRLVEVGSGRPRRPHRRTQPKYRPHAPEISLTSRTAPHHCWWTSAAFAALRWRHGAASPTRTMEALRQDRRPTDSEEHELLESHRRAEIRTRCIREGPTGELRLAAGRGQRDRNFHCMLEDAAICCLHYDGQSTFHNHPNHGYAFPGVPKLAKLGQMLAEFGGRFGPILCQFWPSLLGVGQLSPTSGQSWSFSGQSWSMRSSLAEFDRCRVKSCRTTSPLRANFGRAYMKAA